MLIRENVPEARLLNGRIKILWYLEDAAILTPLLIILYTGIYFFTYGDPAAVGTMDYVTLGLIALACFAIAFAYVEIRYRKFVYALREKDFLIQKGVVERIRYVIPYEKIQNVTVSRSLPEMILGLGTLHIETAAHVIVENDIVLPGISNDENLVTELIERSREAKEADRSPADSMVLVMNDVLSELRGIRAVMMEEPGGQGGGVREERRAPGKGAGTEPISAELKKTKVLFERPSKKRRR